MCTHIYIYMYIYTLYLSLYIYIYTHTQTHSYTRIIDRRIQMYIGICDIYIIHLYEPTS